MLKFAQNVIHSTLDNKKRTQHVDVLTSSTKNTVSNLIENVFRIHRAFFYLRANSQAEVYTSVCFFK